MGIAYVEGKWLDVDRFFVREIWKYSQTKEAKVINQARRVILVRFLAWIEHVSKTLARERWKMTYMS